MSAKRRSRVGLKLLLAAIAIAGLGYLFMRSIDSTRSEPYTVDRAHLDRWTLALEPARGASAPLLSVRASTELVTELFGQLFRRSMESMNTPSFASIPVVLHGEFDRTLAARMTPDDLLAAARDAGLESAPHTLRCLVHRRVSEPGSTRQVYFVLVDSPAIVAFRERLAASIPGAFDAGALSPVMFVGGSDAGFHHWLPIRAGERDCVAPVQTTG
jgi:hypothetical protein